MEQNFRKGVIFALLSAVSGAYLFIFGKMVLGTINTETFCSLYYLFASLYFTVWMILRRRTNLMKVPPASLRVILSVGLLEILSVITLFSAIHIMDPTLVSFFNNSQTIFIILLSAIFLRERFNRLESIGTVIALFGVFLISFRSAAPILLGMILTLSSAVFFSCTVILVKKNLCLVSPLTVAFYRAILLMVVLNLYTVATGGFMSIPAPLILATAAGALFGPFLNILFYFNSLRYFDASKTSLIRASQPLFVLVNAALFLHSIPKLKEIAGGLVITAGLFILVKGHERFTRERPLEPVPDRPPLAYP